MREPPQLPDDTIRRALLAGFGTRVAGLAFLPVGDDADSWAYRVEIGDGSTLFPKVRAGSGDAPGALVPHHLARHGVPGVLAPLPTREGGPAVQADGFALALYPMVDGRTATEARLSAAQWRQLGAMVRQLHFMELFASGGIVDLARTREERW